MRKFILFIAIMFGGAMFATAQEGLPSNPEDNSCYVKCIVPDTYKTEEVTVEIRPAYKKLTIVPAEYKTVEERVVTKEASVRYEFIPAQYETKYIDYTSKEGFNKLAITPASFGDGEEVIETYPKVSRWESQAYEGCESENPADCQVWCWRAYDAQSTTVATKNLSADANTSPTPVALQTGKYAIQVVTQKAEIKEIAIPEEYKTITKTVLVKDETVVEEIIPAEFQTVTKTLLDVKGSPSKFVQIDCELLEYSVLPINFASGSAALSSRAKSIIDTKLLRMMKDKDGVRVEIGAHTDSRGNKSSNKSLSERRAQSVVNYLIAKGIGAKRLVAVGYGEERLKNKCSDGVSCSDAEHAANRRVEFRVLNF